MDCLSFGEDTVAVIGIELFNDMLREGKMLVQVVLKQNVM
jgi:hypothetical protein